MFVTDTDQLEVLNGMTGRQEGENTSRLSKRTLYERFQNLVKQLPTITKIDPDQVTDLSYGQAKQLSKNYQVSL